MSFRIYATWIFFVLFVAADVSISIDHPRARAQPPTSATAKVMRSAPESEVDGVLVGYLPPGYERVDELRTTDEDGQGVTEVRYCRAAARRPMPSEYAAPSDLTVAVWRTEAGSTQDYSARVEVPMTAKNRVTLSDHTSTWENTRREVLSERTAVVISGVEISATVIDRIAASLGPDDAAGESVIHPA